MAQHDMATGVATSRLPYGGYNRCPSSDQQKKPSKNRQLRFGATWHDFSLRRDSTAKERKKMDVVATALFVPVILSGALTLLLEVGYDPDLRNQRANRDLPKRRIAARREGDKLATGR
ncbi:MAG: hypothetical protein V3V08_26170 [Nannocystaceae bacterium]